MQEGLKEYIRKRKSEDNRKDSIIGESLLFIGVFIVLSASIYMIVNLSKLDSIISIWFPILIAGVYLLYLSLIFKLIHKKPADKDCYGPYRQIKWRKGKY